MKKLNILLFLMLASFTATFAQTAYNPFTQNIHFMPEPIPAGFECGTVQTVVFTQGLTTADDATLWQTDPLTVTICIGGFDFNGPASSIVSGSYASNFNWAFSTTSPNCIIGTQNQTLKGTGGNPIFPDPLSSGDISLSLKVPDASPVGTILSVDVTLQVPTYMATFNSIPDDNESTQTQTFCGCYVLTSPGSIAGNQAFCVSGDPVAFTSIAPGSGGSGGVIQYQWQELTGGIWVTIPGATDESYDAPSTSVSKSYRRNTKRSLCGNFLNSDTVNVTINNLPTVAAGPDRNLDCNTTSAIIGTTGIAGNSYDWSPVTGLDAVNIAQPTATPNITTSYTVTVTNANGCTATDVVIVNVNNTLPTADAGPDKDLNCSVTSAIIGTPSIAGNVYVWLPATGLNATNIAQPIANPSATTIYTLTVIGLNGCLASDLITVNVDNTLPTADAGPDKDLNCSVTSAIIGTPSIAGNVYVWLPATGLDAANIAQPTANPSTTTIYTLTVIGTNGCAASDVVTVNVDNTLPTVDAGIAKNTCVGDSVLIGTPAIAGYIYAWSPTIGLSASDIAQPMANPAVTTTYTLTVTSPNGCIASDDVNVSVAICFINIAGNVYKDTNALTDALVNGPVISTPDSTQLYANLVNASGIVIATTPIAADGTFEFKNVAVNQTYNVILSMVQGVVGMTAQTPELPGTWVPTGEDCCDKLGDDGNVNGVNIVVVGTSDVFNIDFGIKDPFATGVPVVLKNFYVIENNCNALLSWVTSSESNTSHVDIYRKSSSKDYRKIATVRSAGESSLDRNYAYIDKDIIQNELYEYRLKFVDIDGQYTVSDIRTITLTCEQEATDISIFPNPASNELNVMYVTEQSDVELSLAVVDIAGRKIIAKSQLVNQGANFITLDVSTLATGTYFLHYGDLEGLTEGTIKFVKQ